MITNQYKNSSTSENVEARRKQVNETEQVDDSVDVLMNTIMRKLTHVHIDGSAKIHQYDYCENSSKIELLLPYQQRSIVQALLSDVVEYQINAMVKLRRYLSLEKISNNINNVLALRMIPRFVELLRSSSPILQYETCWVITNIAAGTTSQTRTIIEAGAVPVLIELLKSSNKDVRTQAAWSLGNIAGDCGEFRDIVLHGGSLQPLLELWNGNESIESKNHMLQVAMWTLANLCRWHRSDWDVLAPAFPILRQSIYFEDPAILSETCWALSRIFHGSHPKVTHLLDLELCQRLVELLKNENVSVVNPVLRTLTNIAYGDDQQTQLIIDAGAIPILYKLLSSPNASIRLETILVLANITAGTVAQVQSVIDTGCLHRLIDILNNNKESFKIRKEACWTISNATDVKHPQQTRIIIQMGVIGLLLKFLTECTYDTTIQQKCIDALENILTVCDVELSHANNSIIPPTSYSNWNFDPWKVSPPPPPSSVINNNTSNSFISASTSNENADNLLSKTIKTAISSSKNNLNTLSSFSPSSSSSTLHSLSKNSILNTGSGDIVSSSSNTSIPSSNLTLIKNDKASSNFRHSSNYLTNSGKSLNDNSNYNNNKKSKVNQYIKWASEMSAFNQLWKTVEILESSMNKSGYYHSQDNHKVLNRIRHLMERWYGGQAENIIDTERQIDEVMMGVENVRITEVEMQ